MPTKPTPSPDTATLAQCRQLGATWLRYQGKHWALRGVAWRFGNCTGNMADDSNGDCWATLAATGGRSMGRCRWM